MKLTETLAQLSKEDLKQFELFLQSPYFKMKSRDRLIGLLSALTKKHPDYPKKISDNDYLIQQIGFKNVRNLKTELLDQLIVFIKQEAYNNTDVHYKDLLLVRELKAKGLYDEAFSQIDLNLKSLNNGSSISSRTILHKYLFIREYFTITRVNVFKDTGRFDAMFTNLNDFYLNESLRNHITARSLSYHIKRGIDPVSDTMLRSVESIKESEQLEIQLMYNSYQFYAEDLLERRKNYYAHTKSLAFERWQELSEKERAETYVRMYNMAKLILYAGEREYKHEVFELTDFWIDKKVHLTYGLVKPNMFINIVTTALDADELDWCTAFINDNESFVMEEHKESALNIANAEVAHYQKKYKDALQLLRMSDISYLPLTMLARVLELKCLYEIKDDNLLIQFAKNLENYLRRNKRIPQTAIEGHMNFLKVLRKLIKVRFQKDPTLINDCNNYINDSDKNLFYRFWLKDQLSLIDN